MHVRRKADRARPGFRRARSAWPRRRPSNCSTRRPGIFGQREILCPLPLALGVTTTSTSPSRSFTRSASIIAFRANAAPVSRWHQRQWQQCTIIGGRRHPVAHQTTGTASVIASAMLMSSSRTTSLSGILRHSLLCGVRRLVRAARADPPRHKGLPKRRATRESPARHSRPPGIAASARAPRTRRTCTQTQSSRAAPQRVDMQQAAQQRAVAECAGAGAHRNHEQRRHLTPLQQGAAPPASRGARASHSD